MERIAEVERAVAAAVGAAIKCLSRRHWRDVGGGHKLVGVRIIEELARSFRLGNTRRTAQKTIRYRRIGKLIKTKSGGSVWRREIGNPAAKTSVAEIIAVPACIGNATQTTVNAGLVGEGRLAAIGIVNFA